MDSDEIMLNTEEAMDKAFEYLQHEFATVRTGKASPALVENIDVRIINVDVVVTDKRGNFIPNLTADDFIILENSVPKPITNFYEVQGSVAAVFTRQVGEPVDHVDHGGLE